MGPFPRNHKEPPCSRNLVGAVGSTDSVIAMRLRPFFARSANKILSGVNGLSRSRTPTASYMAFEIAGIVAASEPSPASLAPKGPSGSMLSMMMHSISGDSDEDGL